MAALSVAGAVLMVTRTNPVHSALSLVLTFASVAALYVLLRAPLLAVLQVAVYAGAIMVLFVFVVMLLAAERRSQTATDPLIALRWPAYVFGAAFLGAICYAVWTTPALGPVGNLTEDVVTRHAQVVGEELFTTYLLPFEVTSILLLAAMLGAIVLAKRRLE
jgi:NADH-quinone oxidoreductase subunit J